MKKANISVKFLVFLLILIFIPLTFVVAQPPKSEQQLIFDVSMDSVDITDSAITSEIASIYWQDPALMYDMCHTTNVGAYKGGGVGALVVAAHNSSANVLKYHTLNFLIAEDSFTYIIDAAVNRDLVQFVLDLPPASIRFTERTDIALWEKGDFNLKIQYLSNDKLGETAKTIIGNHPIVKFDIQINNKPIPPLNGKIQIYIPYEFAKGEDGNNIALYRIDDSAKLTVVSNSICKVQKNMSNINQGKCYVQALIDEPGTYAVGYNNVTYSDVSGWANPYVSFVAQRNIMNDFNGFFKPHDNITRGDLAFYLANISDEDIEALSASAFIDVSPDHPYAKSIAWAYNTGVITGYEDKTFRPDQVINRQELAAMLYRYTQIIAKTYMPKVNTLKSFKDDNLIGVFAKDAVYCLQQAGIVEGKGNNTFDPLNKVTRAECAKMISGLINSIIDGSAKFTPTI